MTVVCVPVPVHCSSMNAMLEFVPKQPNHTLIGVCCSGKFWSPKLSMFEERFLIKTRLMGHNSIKLFIEQSKCIIPTPQENPVQRKLFRKGFPLCYFIEQQQWLLGALYEKWVINPNQLVKTVHRQHLCWAYIPHKHTSGGRDQNKQQQHEKHKSLKSLLQQSMTTFPCLAWFAPISV